MEWNIESIVFYMLLVDAIGANILMYRNKGKQQSTRLQFIFRYFPTIRGWALYYLILVIIVGIVLYRLDALVLPFN